MCDRMMVEAQRRSSWGAQPPFVSPKIIFKFGRNTHGWLSAPIGLWAEPPSHFEAHLAKAFACSFHISLLGAALYQHFQPSLSAYLRNSSSHLNQWVLPGRRSLRLDGNSASVDCHAESLHAADLLASRSSDIRITCPAHDHLLLE